MNFVLYMVDFYMNIISINFSTQRYFSFHLFKNMWCFRILFYKIWMQTLHIILRRFYANKPINFSLSNFS